MSISSKPMLLAQAAGLVVAAVLTNLVSRDFPWWANVLIIVGAITVTFLTLLVGSLTLGFRIGSLGTWLCAGVAVGALLSLPDWRILP